MDYEPEMRRFVRQSLEQIIAHVAVLGGPNHRLIQRFGHVSRRIRILAAISADSRERIQSSIQELEGLLSPFPLTSTGTGSRNNRLDRQMDVQLIANLFLANLELQDTLRQRGSPASDANRPIPNPPRLHQNPHPRVFDGSPPSAVSRRPAPTPGHTEVAGVRQDRAELSAARNTIRILQEQSRQASDNVQRLMRENETLRAGQTQPLPSDRSMSVSEPKPDDTISRHSNSAAQPSSSSLRIGTRATDDDNAAPVTAPLNPTTQDHNNSHGNVLQIHRMNDLYRRENSNLRDLARKFENLYHMESSRLNDELIDVLRGKVRLAAELVEKSKRLNEKVRELSTLRSEHESQKMQHLQVKRDHDANAIILSSLETSMRGLSLSNRFLRESQDRSAREIGQRDFKIEQLQARIEQYESNVEDNLAAFHSLDLTESPRRNTEIEKEGADKLDR